MSYGNLRTPGLVTRRLILLRIRRSAVRTAQMLDKRGASSQQLNVVNETAAGVRVIGGEGPPCCSCLTAIRWLTFNSSSLVV